MPPTFGGKSLVTSRWVTESASRHRWGLLPPVARQAVVGPSRPTSAWGHVAGLLVVALTVARHHGATDTASRTHRQNPTIGCGAPAPIAGGAREAAESGGAGSTSPALGEPHRPYQSGLGKGVDGLDLLAGEHHRCRPGPSIRLRTVTAGATCSARTRCTGSGCVDQILLAEETGACQAARVTMETGTVDHKGDDAIGAGRSVGHDALTAADGDGLRCHVTTVPEGCISSSLHPHRASAPWHRHQRAPGRHHTLPIRCRCAR